MRLRKIILYSCVFLAVVLFSNGISALSRYSSLPKYNTENIKNDGDDDHAVPFETIDKELDTDNTKKPVNLLVLGIDEEGVRSDVILLVNFNPNNGGMGILSVARDTRVRIKGRFEKINAMIGMGGEKLAVKAMEQLTGLRINYYITMNFQGFRKIIDMLEGVEFHVPFDMDYDDPDQNLHIHLREGYQVLNGQKAEQLVRYRKGNRTGEGYADGDIGRIKMQQGFIKALAQQKLKLKYLSKADDIFLILKKHMKTNLEIGDINTYLKDFYKIRYDQIKMYTVPGESAYVSEIWYFICDKDKTKKLIENNFYR